MTKQNILKQKKKWLSFEEVALLRFLLLYLIGQYDINCEEMISKQIKGEFQKIKSKQVAAEQALLAFGSLHPKLDAWTKRYLKEEIAPLCKPLPEIKGVSLTHQTGKEFILTHFPDDVITSLAQKLTAI